MHFVFRSDASKDIGAGHVMRCIALAQELKRRGHNITFVGNICDLDWLMVEFKKTGFNSYIRFDAAYNAKKDRDILIVDSYNIPTSNSFIQPKKWKFIVAIADEFTPNYICNLRIYQNISMNFVPSKKISTLFGPDYVLIRNSLKKSILKDTKEPSILVAGGGSDTLGFCSEMGKTLDKLNLPFSVVFFSNNIVKSNYNKKFTTLPIGLELESISSKSDLAFITASSMSLEFIAKEIPIGIACSVNNQLQYYNELKNSSLAVQIGIYNPKVGWKLNEHLIAELIESQCLRRNLRNVMSGLIDLKGPQRIANELERLLNHG
jgi:spore coat polysaccharide biosynthesis predicted glycosyltransferase SpsG